MVIMMYYHNKTNLLSLRYGIFWNFVTSARYKLPNKGHLWVLDLHIDANGLCTTCRVHAAVVHDAVKSVRVDDGRCEATGGPVQDCWVQFQFP